MTKVKKHTDEEMVQVGRVRVLDRLVNSNVADEVADFGRRRVDPAVIDARRNLSGVCRRWYPIILDLHRFFIAISYAVVNHDDFVGTAPDPLVWSGGALSKRRRLVHAVRNYASLPGPAPFQPLIGSAFFLLLLLLRICYAWPYSVGIWVKWVAFQALCTGRLLGPMWRLVEPLISRLRKLCLDAKFQCRMFLVVQALIFGESFHWGLL